MITVKFNIDGARSDVCSKNANKLIAPHGKYDAITVEKETIKHAAARDKP